MSIFADPADQWIKNIEAKRVRTETQAEASNPQFDMVRYRQLQARDAQNSRARLGANRQQRRLGGKPVSEVQQQPLTEEEKAHLETGRQLIQASSPREVYEMTVSAAYSRMPHINQRMMIALTEISYNFGLNPAPGLDLIYMWFDDSTKKVHIHISYKGWLAMAHRRNILVKSREMTAEECEERGLKAGECGHITEIYPLDILEQVQQAQALGYSVKADDFVVIGSGIWRSGYNTPKGRDNKWVAKKNSIKDAATQFMAPNFNLGARDLDGFYYDPDSGDWVSADPVMLPEPSPEPEAQPEPAAKPKHDRAPMKPLDLSAAPESEE